MPERYLTEKERLQRDVRIRDRKITLLEQRLEYAKNDARILQMEVKARGYLATALVEAAGGMLEIDTGRLNEIANTDTTVCVKHGDENGKIVFFMRPDEDAEDSAENA